MEFTCALGSRRGWKKSELFDPNSQVAWATRMIARHGVESFPDGDRNPKPSTGHREHRRRFHVHRAAPFILAMSVEGAESTLPANRPLPLRKPVRELYEFDNAVYRGEITVRVTDGPSGAPPKNAVVSLGITDDKEIFSLVNPNPTRRAYVGCRIRRNTPLG